VTTTSNEGAAAAFGMAQQAAASYQAPANSVSTDVAQAAVDQYRAEAQYEPFRELLPDGSELLVPWPTGEQMMRIAESGSEIAVAKVILGDQYDHFMATVGQRPFPEMMKFIERMMKYFGMGESSA